MDEEEGAPPAFRPLLVLDGANVVRACPQPTASLAPLLACDRFWRSHGFEGVVSVLPMGMEAQAATAEEQHWVAAARSCGALVLVPCRDRGADDLFSISLAVQHNGFLVSNDRYADHTGAIAASSGAAEASVAAWLAQRVVTFAWGGPAHFLPHPLSLNAAMREGREGPPSLGVWSGPYALPMQGSFGSAAMLGGSTAMLGGSTAMLSSGTAMFSGGAGGGGSGPLAAPQRLPAASEAPPRAAGAGQCRECGESGHGRMQCPQLRCFNCNGVGVGHLSAECPHPRKPPLTCWTCGQPGHRRDQCPGASGGAE